MRNKKDPCPKNIKAGGRVNELRGVFCCWGGSSKSLLRGGGLRHTGSRRGGTKYSGKRPFVRVKEGLKRTDMQNTKKSRWWIKKKGQESVLDRRRYAGARRKGGLASNSK